MFNPQTGNYDSLADTGYTRSQIDAFFSGLVSRYGAPYQSGDAESLIAKLVGGSGYITALGGDPTKAFAEFEQQYARRGLPDRTPDVEGSGNVDSSTLNVGTTRTALAGIAPATSAPVASKITTLGASASSSTTPTVGPTGLAYADDPVNYATGAQGAEFGYSSGGILPSGIYSSGLSGAPPAGAVALGGGADNTMVYLLLAGAAVAAYFLFVK